MSGCGRKYLGLSMVEKFLAGQRCTLHQGFQASHSFRRPSSNLHSIRFSSKVNLTSNQLTDVPNTREEIPMHCWVCFWFEQLGMGNPLLLLIRLRPGRSIHSTRT